jgi:ribosomal protein S18 acetylase RimI-like enzyme
MRQRDPVSVRVIAAEEASEHLEALSGVLADCVAGGASVSFMPPFAKDEARAWWPKIFESMRHGETILLGAFDGEQLVGTVQLAPAGIPNQPHRADIRKVLVHRCARNSGAGAALMRAAEAEARKRGFTLLTLDTATGGAAERLYRRLGWTFVGVIPNYALYPDGRPCDTSIFWKAL